MHEQSAFACDQNRPFLTDCLWLQWDRQPYVYRLNESETDGTGELRISPQTQTISNNLIYVPSQAIHQLWLWRAARNCTFCYAN